MVGHKILIITFLQGTTLFLITTCKAPITLKKMDSNRLLFDVSIPHLRDNISKDIERMNIDENWKRLFSDLNDEIFGNFGDRNDTEMKVNLNINKPVRHSEEIFRQHHTSDPSASDTKTAGLNEGISEIDDKLREYRESICHFDPPKPDFESKGHRTSQARCLDYIWDIKLEEERSNKMCRDSFISYITSGNKVHAGDYPHMGAIGWPAKEDRWIFLCGSSLISEKFVLTVAHCHSVSEEDNRVTHHKPKIVRFGVVNIKTDGHPVDIKIRRFISHPKYNYTEKYNDIALIELDNVVRFTRNIRPACLWNKFSFQNMKTAAVTGWGVSDPTSSTQTTTPNLQVATLDIIDYKECRDVLRMKKTSDWWGLARHQICAGKLDGDASTCEGDSGGPIQTKLATDTIKSVHSIIGVTSVGFGCGMTRFPSLYTRVSSFIEWIEKEVWVQDVEETRTPLQSHETHDHEKHTYRYHQKHTHRYSPKLESKHPKHGKHWYRHSHGYQPHRHNHHG